MNANQDTFRGPRPAITAGLCGLFVWLPSQRAAIVQAGTESNSPAPVAEIPEGYYLFEEDIVLPLGDSVERASYGTDLWPNGVVPFQFDGNVSAANQQDTLDAMDAWEAVANVDFVARNGESDFLHIQDAAFNASEGVGMNGGRHDIWISDWTFGILVHELGHALAYWHEQPRADRDAFVQINWDNVSQTRCDGSCDSQFEVRGAGGEYGPYDFDSVMHYGACSFTCCRDAEPCESFDCASNVTECRTISVVPPFDVDWQNDIGQRTHLSVFDALTMSFLYPLPDWRFVDQDAGGFDVGTFAQPYRTLNRATTQTPAGGTLWFLQPDYYSAVGNYERAMTWRAGYGTVTLGG